MNNLKNENGYIGDVRSRGLMLVVEFVKNHDTKEPFKEIVDKIRIGVLRRAYNIEGRRIWKYLFLSISGVL